MDSIKEKVAASTAFIRRKTTASPTVGIVLGSGLGDFADSLPHPTTILTREIPYYPASSIEGHKGRLVFSYIGRNSVLAFQGRVHFYESNDIDAVLYPIHVAHELGVRTLIITNAAGGINRTFEPGDLVVLFDQINLTTLLLPPKTETTRREVSPYSKRLIEKAMQAAAAHGIVLKKGSYAGLKGPSYETAAEIEMIHRIGGDAVGMSTVMEVSLALSLGMEVLGISCITNLATGISSKRLSHDEVTEVANRVKKNFGLLLSSTVELI